MEHFRSTLATTAAAVLGLVVAAQIVNPHDPSLEIVRPRPILAADATGAATGGPSWTDPPAQGAAASAAFVTSAQAAESVAEPAMDATPRAPALTMMPWPAFGEAAPRAERTRKAERSRRHREARTETRRPAPPPEATPAPQETAARTAAQDASGRDPIGALLRGLGIGRDREG